MFVGNRSYAQQLLKGPLGGAWYLHLVLVVIGCLLICSFSSYCCTLSRNRNRVFIRFTLLTLFSFVTFGALRGFYFCIGPYSVGTDDRSNLVFHTTLHVLFNVTFSLELFAYACLQFALLRMEKCAHSTMHVGLLYLSYGVSAFLLVCSFGAAVNSPVVQMALHLTFGLWIAVLGLTCLAYVFRWLQRQYQQFETAACTGLQQSSTTSGSDLRFDITQDEDEDQGCPGKAEGEPRFPQMAKSATKSTICSGAESNSRGRQFYNPYDDDSFLPKLDRDPSFPQIHINDNQIVVEIVKSVSSSPSTSDRLPATQLPSQAEGTKCENGYTADSELDDGISVTSTQHQSIACTSASGVSPRILSVDSLRRGKINKLAGRSKLCKHREVQVNELHTTDFSSESSRRHYAIMRKVLRHTHGTIVTAFLLAAVHIYSAFGRYGMQARLEDINLSLWLFFHSVFRLLEFAFISSSILVCNAILSDNSKPQMKEKKLRRRKFQTINNSC